MSIIVAWSVALGLNLLILIRLEKRYDHDLYRIVAAVYLGTITLRYILAIYLWLNHSDPGFARMFWGDSETYDYLAATAAQEWSQNVTAGSWTQTIEGKANRGFIYFIAAIYYVFGRNTLLVQLLNGIIGAFTSICILEIGLLLYGRRVAVLAMLFTAFFPQLLFWSSGLYKDPTVMLCITLHMLATLQMMRRFRISSLLLYVGSAFALMFIRFYIFYVVVAASLLGLFAGHKGSPHDGHGRSLYVRLFTQMALVTCLILAFLFTPLGHQALSQQRFFDLEQLQRSRADLSSAKSGYLTDADVSTPMGALKVLPFGIMYLLFSPFPWTASNLRQLLTVPDVLVWYLMFPALVSGLYRAVRYKLGPTIPILIFTTALTVAYGVFQGNAGAAYRQRTQIMMFYFLFIADGMTKTSLGTKDELEPVVEPAPDTG